MERLKNMSRCILGNAEGFFNPCQICKHKDIIGVTACYCTKNFSQVVEQDKIVNVVGACTYDGDEYEKVHNRMIEELAKDYAERNKCSTVSIFENGKFTRNITVEN